jgi:hypothetical protein
MGAPTSAATHLGAVASPRRRTPQSSRNLMPPTPHDDLDPAAGDHTQKEGREKSHCDLRVKHFSLSLLNACLAFGPVQRGSWDVLHDHFPDVVPLAAQHCLGAVNRHADHSLRRNKWRRRSPVASVSPSRAAALGQSVRASFERSPLVHLPSRPCAPKGLPPSRRRRNLGSSSPCTPALARPLSAQFRQTRVCRCRRRRS